MKKKRNTNLFAKKSIKRSSILSLKKNKATAETKSAEKIKTLTTDLQKLKNDFDDLHKKYQFLQAEYANYKKQTSRQMENLKKYDGQFIIQQIVHKVLDNFDTAMKMELTEETITEFRKGIEMIHHSFKYVLKDYGVKELESEGQAFDPTVHFAIGTTSTSEKVPSDHVSSVIKKAYLFHDKLIRPAEVIVAKNKEKTEPETKNKEKAKPETKNKEKSE